MTEVRHVNSTLIRVRQEVIVQLPSTVFGKFSLCIEYTGLINRNYTGLYLSQYTHHGEKKYIASTQFEASDARRAFPCFDQPARKATFDIELVIPDSLTGISNAALISEQPLENGKKRVKFARTPRMSTYLVFFGIGEFEFIKDAFEHPRVRVAVTSGKTGHGQFALDMARKTLRFGEEYTGIPFPISKCDYIAIPDSIGAMENFGAIRHCENDLLIDPDTTSKARAVLTAKIIAHEGIHQWFGDLVSPMSWKDLWLNEGFATYFTYVIPHHFHPEWGVWEQFFLERLLSGMERDSLSGTIPIDLPEMGDPEADPSPTPSTAPIVYNKGAAVVRMLATYIGEDYFKQSLHDFLTRYQFDAASSEHFWESVSKSTNLPLEKFARAWVNQPGYPLVTVQREKHTLQLTQSRFTYRHQPATDSTWVIPVDVLCFLADGGTRIVHILLDQVHQSVKLPENVTAYKVNAELTGFYRVHYPEDDLERLGELLSSKRLPAVDSLNVLNDVFAMVKAGVYSVDDYLRYISSYAINETRYLPLMDLARNLSHLYRTVKVKHDDISRVGKPIYERVLDSIGYIPSEDESLTVTELRSTLLMAASLLGSQTVLEFAVRQFQLLLDGGIVHRDIFSEVLKIGAVVHPKAADWLSVRACDLGLLEGGRIKALQALGNLSQYEALQKALDINNEQVASSLRHHMLAEASCNPFAFDWMWDWYTGHLAQIETEIPLPNVQSIMVCLIPLCGIGHRQEVEACLHEFSTRHPATSDSLEMALELLAVNERLHDTKRN